MCVTDRHDMTLTVKVALKPNTTNQPKFVRFSFLENVEQSNYLHAESNLALN